MKPNKLATRIARLADRFGMHERDIVKHPQHWKPKHHAAIKNVEEETMLRAIQINRDYLADIATRAGARLEGSSFRPPQPPPQPPPKRLSRRERRKQRTQTEREPAALWGHPIEAIGVWAGFRGWSAHQLDKVLRHFDVVASTGELVQAVRKGGLLKQKPPAFFTRKEFREFIKIHRQLEGGDAIT